VTDEKKKITRKKAQVIKSDCVACGTCLTECPLGAIKVVGGVFAEIDQSKCVGCGKCAIVCPASSIEINKKEEEK